MRKIGFIGIGKMGRYMAENLLSADYCVTVYDINREATVPLEDQGAYVATNVKEIGMKSDIVITMLPNSKIVESIILSESGLLETMQPDTIILDMSSSYVFSTKEISKKLQIKRISLIDAPVSGGVPGAKEGSLTIMVGANKEEDYAKVLPILNCLGKNIKLVGDVGSGHALKAINNYLSACSLYATTEAMVLAKTLGLDLHIALESINKSSGQSFSTHYKFPNFVLPRNFNSGFSLDLLMKDVKMVNEMAKNTNVSVLMASLVEQIYRTASLMGDESQDHTEVVKLLEEITKVKVEAKKESLS